MTIERTRPLPVGRYWIDVFESHRVAWEAWQNSFVGSGKATVEHTEDFPSDGANESRSFVIFRTNERLVWPDDTMGIGVNVAPASIQSSADTVTRPPPPPSPLDSLSDFSAMVGRTLAVLVGTVVVVGGVVLFAKGRKR
jgi:hypothetical protein